MNEYDTMHMGHPLVPGSPYYGYDFECGCGWEYNESDAEVENDICPFCGKIVEYK